SDSGRYEYQVEGAPEPKHLVTLYVEPRQVKEKILHLPQTTFNIGESILMKIDFDENDYIAETPKWYRNEMLIPIGNNTPRHKQITDLTNRTHTFEIFNLQVEDTGVYEMRTSHLTVKTPEIKIIPKQKEEEIIPEQVSRQSSITIDMNKHKEQPLEAKPFEEFLPVEDITPIHEVTEGDMMHLTVEKPSTVPLSNIKILKNNQPLSPSNNIHIQATSPTSIDIKFSPVELIDQGYYSISIRDQIQPIMQLNVREKPIQRQIMNLPQDTFIESETLTIECKFDVKPDTQFVWTKDGSILLNDSRINIKQKNETFTLIIKDLKPSDQGVYSLESKYLILDTPFITVLPKPHQPTVEIEHEETTITIQPNVSVTDTKDETEEVIITQQPAKQIQAPTAVIQSEDNQIDETVTTTTTIEGQQQPTFQANSSAIQPEQTTEEITVQTQVSVPTEQPIEVKTTTTAEEIQPEATVTVIEQPKPTVETVETKEEENISSTTQVEEQPALQFATDASSTQPETKEE
ncbi:unnamed protein product, partial [Adineta steineri]